jgi:hypothetical protein
MGANVNLPLPLVRLPPWFGGQQGVPGTDVEEGLRTHPTGAVFYVDPNYPGASDQRDGTRPDDPLRTVAAALTKCQAFRGDTIIVGSNDNWPEGGPTDYSLPVQEAITVSVPGVRIVGAAQSSPAGVPWLVPAAGGPCISVHALDVLIEGFAFIGGAVGGIAIYAEWDGFTLWADNLVVRHCWFDDEIDTGIQLEFIWAADIHDNVFHECDAYGIRVDPMGSGISHCKIHDNWLQDCGISNLSLEGATECLVAGNRVFGALAQGAAPAANELIDTAAGGRNLVASNVLSCLLPVPANGDYNDACSSSATDAWVANLCMNGTAITNPT